MQNQNALGIDALVLLAVNALQTTLEVFGSLKDGFQLPDLFVLVGNVDNVQTIAASAPQAWSEIKDLTPDELDQFEVRVSAEANLPNTEVVAKVRTALRLASRAYRLVLEGKELVEDFTDAFKK